MGGKVNGWPMSLDEASALGCMWIAAYGVLGCLVIEEQQNAHRHLLWRRPYAETAAEGALCFPPRVPPSLSVSFLPLFLSPPLCLVPDFLYV